MASPPRAISIRPPKGPAGSPAAARSTTRSPFSAPGRVFPSTVNVSSFTSSPFQFGKEEMGNGKWDQPPCSPCSPFPISYSLFPICSARLAARLQVPIQDLFAVPDQHVLVLPQALHHRLEIPDPV